MTTPKKLLLSEPLVQLALALLAGIFLSWPIIQVAAESGANGLFAYIFALWGGLVLLLWRIGRAIVECHSTATDDRSGSRSAAGRER